jgi:hypothetical protein
MKESRSFVKMKMAGSTGVLRFAAMVFINAEGKQKRGAGKTA